MKTKIEIKYIWGSVLFSYEKENNTIKDTLEEAVKGGANLHCADLRWADLHGADLHGADLRGANLVGANLHGADLSGANLRGADLHGADLHGGNLSRANLRGADLGDADLHGADLHGGNLSRANLRGADLGDANLGSVDFRRVDLRWVDLSGANLGDCGKLNDTSDILIVGPIGSRNDYTTIFHTDKGIFVQCGCFKGSLREFEAKVKETHGENKHSKDYLTLIDFVKVKYDEREDKE